MTDFSYDEGEEEESFFLNYIYNDINKHFNNLIKDNPIFFFDILNNNLVMNDSNIKNENNNDMDIEKNSNLEIIVGDDENNEFISQTNYKIKNIEKNKFKNKSTNRRELFELSQTSEKTHTHTIKLGRKTKNSERINCNHDKFSDDNLIRKVKCILLDDLYLFINKLLKKIYNIEKIKREKILLKMKQNQVINSKADYNRDFLNKKLEYIFSEDISTKYTKYCPEHNRNLIISLLNEEDEQKKAIFKKIFNLTFFECLEHFRGTKYIMELNGLTLLDDICKKFKNDLAYVKKFKHYVFDFETIINIKKLRNTSKRKFQQE